MDLISKNEEDKLVDAIETRNISVHNRCVINERYISKVNSDPKNIGKIKKLVLHHIEDMIPLLFHAVNKLDKDARKKFKLKGKRFDLIKSAKNV